MHELPNPLLSAAANWPNLPAIISSEGTFTWSQVLKDVAAVSTWFSAQGIAPQDRVAISAENSPDYVITLLALMQLRAVACPLSTRIPPEVLPMTESRLHAKLTVTDGKLSTAGGAKRVRMATIREASGTRSETGNLPEALDSLGHATIVFTSGSTGDAKAAVLTIGNHYYSALGSNANILFGPGDRWGLSLPLYHAGGLGILFRTLTSGGAIVIPGTAFATLPAEANRATHHSLILTQLKRILKDPSRCEHLAQTAKAVLVGGSALPDGLITEAARRGLPVFKTYGLTEMASQVTTTGPDDLPDKAATSGRLLEFRKLALAPDGEILVAGETRFAGYDDNGQLIEPFDPDGHFATGDLGGIDGQGYLTVRGRKDSRLVSGGENIYPETIEACLLELEDIEAAVVVAVDSEEYGQRPVAFIKTSGAESADRARFEKHLEKSLPRFMIPDHFFAWPDNALTGGLKVSRKYLSVRARQTLSGS
jgi:O-succinylbenzoic acid--CoA ligase